MRIRQTFGFRAAAIMWMALIFYFSSLPDLKSDLPTLWDFIFRKMAHLCEYAVLYVLWWRSLVDCRRSMLWALMLTFSYAVLDEFHQGFVHGRVASPIDVLIDTCGMLIGLAISKYKIPRHG